MLRTRLLPALFALACGLAPAALPAQGLFSPVAYVDDSVVTRYELDQRIKLLTVFRAPGDLPKLALEQLIDDRLKGAELDRVGLVLPEESLRKAMEEFAQRTQLPLDEFLAQLATQDVAEETLRDFVKIGVSWREYVRGRYLDRVDVTEADIDRALAQVGAGSALQVLLSEIIIAAPPDRAEAAAQVASDIAQMTSTDDFEAAARQVSALPSRTNGGRLDWLPISNYPEQLRPLILGLQPGQVTPPLPIENGIALFQMRGVREAGRTQATVSAIDYAVVTLPGGRSAENLAFAAQLDLDTDGCGDLFGEMKDQPPERLSRETAAIGAIPNDVGLELAKLDPGEMSTALTSADGSQLRVLMLCARLPAASDEINREGVRNQLRLQRLDGYGNALLADLKAAATIILP